MRAVEILDIFLIGLGIITIYEAVQRLRMIGNTREFSEKIKATGTDGNYENSRSYRLLTTPIETVNWSPGIGAYLSERPILIAVIVAIILALFGESVGLMIGYSKVTFVFLAGIFAIAFHSGPDKISIEEHYLQKITKEDQNNLNGHDKEYIRKATSEFRERSFMQCLFGLCFLAAALLPADLFVIDTVFVLIIGFLYLGSKYSIQKGIFGQER